MDKINIVLSKDIGNEISDDERPKDLNKIQLPLILKNRSLMPPGVYNKYYFDTKSIKDSYRNTDWNMKENRSLFTGEHPVKPATREWVGEILNPYIDETTGTLMGDVVIVDMSEAIKIAYGAKFGISPSVEAVLDSHVVNSFRYKNFGLVIQAAITRNYLNNSLERTEVIEMDEKVIVDALSGIKNEIVSIRDDINKMKMSIEEADVSEDEILELAKSGLGDFNKEFRKKYPNATMKDAAKAFKKTSSQATVVTKPADVVPPKVETSTDNTEKKTEETTAKQPEKKEESADDAKPKTDELMKRISDLEKKASSPVRETQVSGAGSEAGEKKTVDSKKLFADWAKSIYEKEGNK